MGSWIDAFIKENNFLMSKKDFLTVYESLVSGLNLFRKNEIISIPIVATKEHILCAELAVLGFAPASFVDTFALEQEVNLTKDQAFAFMSQMKNDEFAETFNKNIDFKYEYPYFPDTDQLSVESRVWAVLCARALYTKQKPKKFNTQKGINLIKSELAPDLIKWEKKLSSDENGKKIFSLAIGVAAFSELLYERNYFQNSPLKKGAKINRKLCEEFALSRYNVKLGSSLDSSKKEDRKAKKEIILRFIPRY